MLLACEAAISSSTRERDKRTSGTVSLLALYPGKRNDLSRRLSRYHVHFSVCRFPKTTTRRFPFGLCLSACSEFPIEFSAC